MDKDKLQKDIAQAIEQYPKLKKVEVKGKLPALEGEIDIKDGDENVLETFEVKIQYVKKFPYAYPWVYETGGKFDKSRQDMHFNGDGTLCLNVEQDEAIESRHGITTVSFIKNTLLPNLAWRICKVEEIDFDLKEHRHGVYGIVDSYAEKFKTKNLDLIVSILGKVINHELPERNEWCFCGERKKYKKCHFPIVNSLALINNDVLKNDYKRLLQLKDSK